MRTMKDSGVEWLGEVPEAWQVKPHWAFLTEKKVPVGNLHSELTLLSLTKQGVIVRDLEAGGKFPTSFEGYQKVAPDDLVLCLFDVEETPRTVGLAPSEGMITSAYTLMRATGINPHFLEWYLIGMDNEKRFKPFYSGLRNTLQKPIFASIRFAVPLSSEQAEIVQYLDQETSQIDTLISKKEQLIEKLLERRQALITQVVTKGLDPNVPMKDSGVEWLGPIPKTWSLARLQRYADFQSGGGFPEAYQGDLSQEFPFLKVDDLGKNASHEIKSWQNTVSKSTASQLGVKILPEGTLVMAKIGAALLLGRVRQLVVPSCIDNNMIGIAPLKKLSGGYFSYFLSILDFAYFVNPGTVPSTSGSAIGANQIPIPPKAEQDLISKYLDKETSQIDTLVEKTRKAIELLKERRQALITQVVTGKIDVRGFAGGNS
jgi:type I restriction enzyme S subunit